MVASILFLGYILVSAHNMFMLLLHLAPPEQRCRNSSFEFSCLGLEQLSDKVEQGCPKWTLGIRWLLQLACQGCPLLELSWGSSRWFFGKHQQCHPNWACPSHSSFALLVARGQPCGRRVESHVGPWKLSWSELPGLGGSIFCHSWCSFHSQNGEESWHNVPQSFRVLRRCTSKLWFLLRCSRRCSWLPRLWHCDWRTLSFWMRLSSWTLCASWNLSEKKKWEEIIIQRLDTAKFLLDLCSHKDCCQRTRNSTQARHYWSDCAQASLCMQENLGACQCGTGLWLTIRRISDLDNLSLVATRTNTFDRWINQVLSWINRQWNQLETAKRMPSMLLRNQNTVLDGQQILEKKINFFVRHKIDLDRHKIMKLVYVWRGQYSFFLWRRVALKSEIFSATLVSPS